MNRIKFASDIITDRVRNKGKRWCRYKLYSWKNKGSFVIFNDVSDHVTLLQLKDPAGNINHAVSITECWIYDSNYERSLCLMREPLYIICSPSRYEKGTYAEFKDFFYAVRYGNPSAKLEKEHLVHKWFLVL